VVIDTGAPETIFYSKHLVNEGWLEMFNFSDYRWMILDDLFSIDIHVMVLVAKVMFDVSELALGILGPNPMIVSNVALRVCVTIENVKLLLSLPDCPASLRGTLMKYLRSRERHPPVDLGFTLVGMDVVKKTRMTLDGELGIMSPRGLDVSSADLTKSGDVWRDRDSMYIGTKDRVDVNTMMIKLSARGMLLARIREDFEKVCIKVKEAEATGHTYVLTLEDQRIVE
jgi:hypothetical protein